MTVSVWCDVRGVTRSKKHEELTVRAAMGEREYVHYRWCGERTNGWRPSSRGGERRAWCLLPIRAIDCLWTFGLFGRCEPMPQLPIPHRRARLDSTHHTVQYLILAEICRASGATRMSGRGCVTRDDSADLTCCLHDGACYLVQFSVLGSGGGSERFRRTLWQWATLFLVLCFNVLMTWKINKYIYIYINI